jgi:predicted RNA-binding protein YlxR (DUF448 family)
VTKERTSRRGERQESADLKKGMRSCIACRRRAPRSALVRLVATSSGQLEVDRYLKAPGRGAHICYAVSCSEVVGNPKVLGRAFKRAVTGADPKRIRSDIILAIEARIEDLLSIGRCAGWAISGTDTLLRRGRRLSLLVLASDVAADTKRRLIGAVGLHECPMVEYGDSARLGRTQKQAHRVAIGVTDGAIAERLQVEIERRSQVLVAG